MQKAEEVQIENKEEIQFNNRLEENVPLQIKDETLKDNLKEKGTKGLKYDNYKNNSKSTLFIYLLMIVAVFVIMIFLFFYIHYGRYRIEVLVTEKDMIKPLVDDRKYKVIKLTNNLEVLIISDMSSSRCSASMAVGVGSFQDDDDINGLAHFTEHMIFLGSKTFPRPGEFEDHLTDYFGLTNAFTEDEKTIFYFEIASRGFQKALLMFSRMFSEPLFDINYMSKEINAVNSENDKNLNQDSWKEHQLLKSLANPHHPFSKFTTGNNNTLGSIDPELLNRRLNSFYNKYYIPNNMKLVILSNKNLEVSQAMVAQYFSDIRLDSLQKGINQYKYGEIRTHETAFSKKELGKVVWYQKLTSIPNMDIVFNIEEVISTFENKPIDYISYLLKFSGEGSLIKYLKDKKYANKVDIGMISSFKNFSQFSISIQLTDKGLENIIPVIDAAFHYINLIKKYPISETIYNEIHNITKTQFKFLEKNEKYGEYIAMLANSMFDYTYRDILYGDYLHINFNKTLINKFMDMVSPENAIVLIGSTKYPPDDYLRKTIFKNSKNETEKWYKTTYMQAKIGPDMIKVLRSEIKDKNYTYEFKMRPQNEFITTESNIVSCLDDNNKELCTKEMQNSAPILFLNQTNLKVWYKLDRSYLVPKLIVNLNIITHFLRTNSEEYMMMKIFYNYLVNNLESTFSDFIQTGNEINLKFDENGYRLTLSLFTDLTEKVFDKLLKLIFSPNIDESNYNQLYQMTQEDVKSSNEFQPFKKTHNSFFKIVKYNVTSILDLIKLQNIKYDKFKSFLKVAINSFSINSLFFGYLKEENLNKIINKIQSNLENSTSLTSVTTANLIDYLHAHKVIYKPVIFRTKNDLKTEKNHAIENFYQVGLKDYKTSLMMNIIEMIWGNMFYYYLRTLKQLGYIVNANKEFIDNNMYFVFIVQGSKKNPSEMNLEIDNIIWRLRDKIITLPRDKLQEVIGSIKNEILKKDTNLKERSKRLWMEIYQNTIDFSRKDKLLIEIDKLVKSDIIEAFDSIFIDRPQKLSIQLYSPSSNILKLEKEEAYYLNANIKYNVTSDVKILDNMQDTATTDD